MSEEGQKGQKARPDVCQKKPEVEVDEGSPMRATGKGTGRRCQGQGQEAGRPDVDDEEGQKTVKARRQGRW